MAEVLEQRDENAFALVAEVRNVARAYPPIRLRAPLASSALTLRSQVDGRAVGLMGLASGVDTSALGACFDLSPFPGLLPASSAAGAAASEEPRRATLAVSLFCLDAAYEHPHTATQFLRAAFAAAAAGGAEDQYCLLSLPHAAAEPAASLLSFFTPAHPAQAAAAGRDSANPEAFDHALYVLSQRALLAAPTLRARVTPVQEVVEAAVAAAAEVPLASLLATAAPSTVAQLRAAAHATTKNDVLAVVAEDASSQVHGLSFGLNCDSVRSFARVCGCFCRVRWRWPTARVGNGVSSAAPRRVVAPALLRCGGRGGLCVLCPGGLGAARRGAR